LRASPPPLHPCPPRRSSDLLQPLVRLADQRADRAVEVERAGSVAVDAHLLLDACAAHGVARAERAVGIRDELRHEEQRDAARARDRKSTRLNSSHVKNSYAV